MPKITKLATKLHKRKKINGYYEASDILTNEEKMNLILLSSIILVPVIIGVTLIVFSSF
ncbi:MAG: hypothetical protein ACTHVE_03420 [Senegalia sp. (in: firmicutes)]|uniref:hypothetical protein n=1 Tax=Senegalia sp. (in: firmicutes) TaxID=1924098 RepID=UPI003F96BCBD